MKKRGLSLSILLLLLFLSFWYDCDGFLPGPRGSSSSVNLIRAKRELWKRWSVFDLIEDEEDQASFRSLTSNYLSAVYRTAPNKSSSDRSLVEVKILLKSILPPVTPDELEGEIGRMTSSLQKKESQEEVQEVSEEQFIEAVMKNPYWEAAGPTVVKELIFLDCLFHFYHRQTQLLSNEDYNELKDQLSWEGSMVASLRGKEALFITAVAAHHRGMDILNNQDYETLKKELQTEQSWVVNRGQDPLERLGFKTFLSYLHRSL